MRSNQIHERQQSRRLRYRFLSIIGIIMTLSVFTTQTYAGSCKDTTKTIKGFSTGYSTHTFIKNTTESSKFYVEILRNSEVKTTKQIGPGDEASHLANYMDDGSNKDISFFVNVGLPGDSSTGANCSFRVTVNANKGKSSWKVLQTPNCQDLSNICTDCSISCDKSWNQDKDRWNVHFKITD